MPILTSKLVKDTGSLSTDGITSMSAITGTADSLAVITVMEGLVVIGTAFADILGAWTFTPNPPLADGSHTLNVTSNVIGTPPASVKFTLDTVAPVVTVALATDTGSSVSDGITQSAVIKGTADAGATVTIMEGVKILGTAVADATTGAWTFNPTTLLDGLHILTVTETDLAGNVGSAFVSFTRDTVAQPAVISGVVGSDASATVNGTGEVGSVLQVFDGTVQIGTATVRTDGSWTLSAPLSLGNHQLKVIETDLAGNTATTVAKTFVVGTPAPDLSAASDHGQSSTDNITNVNKPVFTGSGLQAGATVQLFDNGVTSLGSAIVDASGNWTITSSTLLDGVHSVTVKQTFAGVISAASAALAVTIDTVAPQAPSKPGLTTISDSGSSSSDNITNVITPTFSGTAEAGSLVQVFDTVAVSVIVNNKTTTTNVTTQIASITAAADGTWTTPNSIPLGQQGLHSISATSTDVAGNINLLPAGTQKITIDTIAPISVFNSMTVNADGSVKLTGSVEANAVVSVFDLTKSLGTNVASTAGAFTFTTAATLTDTLHVFLSRATDAAGNVGGIVGQNGSAQVGSTLADVIKSTIGNDQMFGGTGADTFAFLSDFGKDVIQDFAAAGVDHDIINFNGSPVLNNFAAVQKNAQQVGANTVIGQGANTLTLNNVVAKSLIAGDFTFV